LNINELHRLVRDGRNDLEEPLFKVLNERFEQFANHRIWDKEDAKEVVQEALMVIARDYKQTDIQKSFSAWAYKVLNNRILSYIDSKKRDLLQNSSDQLDSLNRFAPSLNPDLRLRLINCLKKIDRVHKQHARIINLHHQGFQVQEICSRLNLTRNAAYISLHRARRMLELCLETGEIKE
jgi:RNA polymerase sigma factor (sigma-70 family)